MAICQNYRKKVIEAISKAGLSYKLDQLPKGIDTQMTRNIHEDGTLFSGGENQKLAISRSIYRTDAKALIMDEPTAALDALAEEKIYRDLEKISEGKTLIFISHRLAYNPYKEVGYLSPPFVCYRL